MYKKYYHKEFKIIFVLLIIALIMGVWFEVIEFYSGRFSRYTYDIAKMFYLIDHRDMPTSLYYWEQDYFRINVHVTFFSTLIGFISFNKKYYKFGTADYSRFFPIFLIVVGFVLIPYALYNGLFNLISPYIFTLSLFVCSATSSALLITSGFLMLNRRKRARLYDFDFRAYFLNNKIDNVLGFFRFNGYTGLIYDKTNINGKYDDISNLPFCKTKYDYYIIFVDIVDNHFSEREFLYKLSYWRYYIENVENKIASKEKDYHDNANTYANNFVDNFYKNNN